MTISTARFEHHTRRVANKPPGSNDGGNPPCPITTWTRSSAATADIEKDVVKLKSGNSKRRLVTGPNERCACCADRCKRLFLNPVESARPIYASQPPLPRGTELQKMGEPPDATGGPGCKDA